MVYRYLFWQEDGGLLRRISLATHETLTLEMRLIDYSIIKLDCVNKHVYGFVGNSSNEVYMSASDYDGGNQRNITIKTLCDYLLHVFNAPLCSINRSIALARNNYYDLIVVYNSLQPLGKL